MAVKRIGLDGLKEEEISQLMKEVDLVKSLSHPSIVKYEGMARDCNTLSIVLELVTVMESCLVRQLTRVTDMPRMVHWAKL